MIKEGNKLENRFMDYGIMQSKILKPKVIIPFGSNLFHSDNPNSVMNKAVATPIDFVNYARKKNRFLSKNYKTMLSGSYVFKINGHIHSHYEQINKKEFNSKLKKFINLYKKNRKKNISKPLVIKNSYLKNIENNLKRNKKKINHKIIISPIDKSGYKILINLNNNKVNLLRDVNLPDNSHYFKIETNEFNQWLKGSLTFEEILGTRRFKYIRKPNVYNIKVMQIYTNYL